MSPFLLRSAIAFTCVVALSPSVTHAQPASSAEVQAEPTPSLTVSAIAAPPIVAPAVAEPSLALRQPTLVTPTAAIPELFAPELETRGAVQVNADVAAVMRRREAFSRPQVLMITGGALLLTGLLVDGDASSILIIAGAGIGGYGLYLYLQTPDARMVR